jgi:PEP-CTERM motif
MGLQMKNIVTAAVATVALALSSAAAANSFQNGGFEATTHGPGQLGYNTDATGWYTSGYNFLYASGTADTSSAAIGQYGINPLWGPHNGSNNGLAASSQNGGNFVAADGDFSVGAISQDISGLTIGHVYAVGFDYAYSQQEGYDGDTVQSWSVTLGDSASQGTSPYTLASHGFSGWMRQTFSFTADATTETLSFLAQGNLPVPPFALLDGVTFSQEGVVPEPAAWMTMVLGLGALGALARRRRAMRPAMA